MVRLTESLGERGLFSSSGFEGFNRGQPYSQLTLSARWAMRIIGTSYDGDCLKIVTIGAVANVASRSLTCVHRNRQQVREMGQGRVQILEKGVLHVPSMFLYVDVALWRMTLCCL